MGYSISMNRSPANIVWKVALQLLIVLALSLPGPGAAASCKPTPQDEMGPFYRPDAPLRSSVGSDYLLRGTVRSAADCRPVKGARIELWLVGPRGQYDDAHRATVVTDGKGRYRFTSNFPPPFYGRPPHIHIRVTAPGFDELITQHYPRPGSRKGSFDLVMPPLPTR